jgi:hypothetical protein
MKNVILLIISLFALSSGVTGEKEETLISEDLITDNLDGWEKVGDFIAEVNDGVIKLSGKEKAGWILYHYEFEDFRLEGEFSVEEGNQSGIAFRYPEAKKGSPAYAGYLMNIDHNLDQQNPTGSIYNVARAKWLKSTNTSGWNKIAIEAQGDHLKVMVNDTLVAEVHDRRSEEGLIGLNIGPNSEAQFRNLKIEELEEIDFIGPQMEDYMRSYEKIGFEPMIEDDNLDSWNQIGEATWEIDDGIIHGYSNENGGFLVHQNAYQNFYLKLKFKIAHEDNSGIFIRHSPEAMDEVSTDNAIECNIYDHDGYLHEFSTGAIVPYARAWSKMIDYEDWNNLEIFAFNDQIIMYVNGIKSSEAHLPEQFNQKGNICIQGGIQVFNDNSPSDIYIKDMFVKNFDGIPYVGF